MKHILPLLTIGCSVGVYDQQPCETSSQCRDAFGLGSICGEAGLCEYATPSDRCYTTYPANVFDDWTAHSDSLIIGSLFDFSSDQPNIEAMNLAIENVNETGLNGQRFILLSCDYANDETNSIDGKTGEEATQSAASFLIEDLQVPVVIGPAGSTDVIYTYPIADAN